MREIKFRIWDGNNKRYDYPEIIELNRGLEYEQFTGLKDKNGKEIYENNILNNRYLVIKLLTKYVLFDILKRDILKEGLKINETEITGQYQEIPENEKRDIDKYLQQAEREIIEKGVAFA